MFCSNLDLKLMANPGYSFAAGTTYAHFMFSPCLSPELLSVMVQEHLISPRATIPRPKTLSGRLSKVKTVDILLVILNADALLGFISPYPSPEQIACQHPKPILLNTVSFSLRSPLNFAIVKNFLGLLSPSLRMVTQYCRYPDVPSRQFCDADHPWRVDDNVWAASEVRR